MGFDVERPPLFFTNSGNYVTHRNTNYANRLYRPSLHRVV
jgi:hypothetical protein